MAYLRGDIYVWSDDYRTHFWSRVDGYADDARDNDFVAGVAIPNDAADAYALMRVAELLAEGKVTRRRTLALSKKYGGNLNADDLARLLGLPTVLDVIAGRSGR